MVGHEAHGLGQAAGAFDGTCQAMFAILIGDPRWAKQELAKRDEVATPWQNLSRQGHRGASGHRSMLDVGCE
jgi:hypothetical protein